MDTSVVVALMRTAERSHQAVRRWIEAVEDELVTTPLAVAEMDYLASTRGGPEVRDALRRDLRRGVYPADWWPGALAESLAVAASYPALSLSLTDASLVSLAARHRTRSVATLDERHFRAVKPLTGEPAFTVLPADA